VSVGNRGILRGLFVDTNNEEMQILVESIVHADTIPELNTNKQEISSESATLVHWLTINPTQGNFFSVFLLVFYLFQKKCMIRKRLRRVTKKILYTWSSGVSSLRRGWPGSLHCQPEGVPVHI
jgi:hypothetical protein